MKLRNLVFLGVACLAGGAVTDLGCSSSDSPAPAKGSGGSNAGGGGTGNTGGGGTGNTGGGGTGNTGGGGTGNTGGGGTGNTGGGGTGNTGGGGTGNTGGGGTGNTGGSGTGGSASTDSGSGGSTSSEGGGDLATCIANAKTNVPGTTDSCATCTCTKCTDTAAAVGMDPTAIALMKCGRVNNCAGDCCFCNNNNGTPCSTTACTGYAQGPCVAETSAAAGFAPQSGTTCYTDGAMLGTACKTGPSGCHTAREFAICVQQQCKTECEPPPACGLI